LQSLAERKGCLVNPSRFDALTRALSDGSSRRGLLHGVVASLGLALVPATGLAKKKKRKKLKRNSFGCVDVGGKCRGNSANCCSSICQGKKPKKGKKDKSRCVAHNALTCQPEQDNCVATPNACGMGGSCFRTTGNASFCGNNAISQACTRDIECEAAAGLGAACVVCPSAFPATITACMPAFPA
jgi:hypothetical protein